MMITAPPLPQLIADGRWLAHRYDEQSDSIHFRLVPREKHQSVTFLTDDALADTPLAVFSRADCLNEARKLPLATPRFIFHSAYCCSTLLARAFDIPGVSFGLKEPQILNDVAGLQLRRSDPRQIAAALDAALLLLARPLGAGEINVIKPSNLINPSIALITAMRPDVRGVLLYAPLEAYLASVARKEIEGRGWVRELMWKLINLGQAERFGFTTEELYRQTDLQVAAAGWLAQHALFAEAAADKAGYRTLDSETLVERPGECMAALASHFAIELDARAVAAGPAFQQHSKEGADFSREQRSAEQARGLEAHRREIGITIAWTHRLAEAAKAPMTLPCPLIA